MITSSSPSQDIKVGDIVINKYNMWSRGRFLKFRVIGFSKIGRLRLVDGFRVKWDKRHKDWVSFGKEQTLHTCYRPSSKDLESLKR